MVEQVMDVRPQAEEVMQLGFDYSQVDEGIRDQVRDAAQKIRAYGESLKGSMIAIGKRLQEVKYMLPHGQFETWIEVEFGLSQRTAQNLMNVAKVYGERKSEIVSFLPDAVLYALAAPSTPEEVRVEIEQRAANGEHVKVADVRESKQAHTEKAAVKFAEPKPAKARPEPEPERYAPVWELESAVRVWLNAEAGRSAHDGRTVDDILFNLKAQLKRPLEGGWLEQLQASIIERHRRSDLADAINNVASQRKQAKAQAEARAVYVEPAHEVGAQPQPADAETIETLLMPHEALRAAGFVIQRTHDERGVFVFRWSLRDGRFGEWLPLAQEAADQGLRWHKAFGDRLPTPEVDDEAVTWQEPTPEQRQWQAEASAEFEPQGDALVCDPLQISEGRADSPDFLSVLNMATRDELVEALCSQSPMSEWHAERTAAIMARLDEIDAPSKPTEADRHASSVELLTSPTIDITTTLPMSLHWAIKQATVEDLQVALAKLPPQLVKGRGPVLRAALKNRGVSVPDVAPTQPDPRIEDAQALIDLLVAARDTAREHYGELTGRHSDMLEFERGIEGMLPHLMSLLEILEGGAE